METIEYYKNCLLDFETALESEKQMEIANESMIKLLAQEIEYCKKKIEELS